MLGGGGWSGMLLSGRVTLKIASSYVYYCFRIPEWLEYLKQYYSVELQTFIAQRDEEIESEPEASSVVDDEDRREKVSAR